MTTATGGEHYRLQQLLTILSIPSGAFFTQGSSGFAPFANSAAEIDGVVPIRGTADRVTSRIDAGGTPAFDVASGTIQFDFELSGGSGERMTWLFDTGKSVSVNHDGSNLTSSEAGASIQRRDGFWRITVPNVSLTVLDTFRITIAGPGSTFNQTIDVYGWRIS